MIKKYWEERYFPQVIVEDKDSQAEGSLPTLLYLQSDPYRKPILKKMPRGVDRNTQEGNFIKKD